MAELSVLGRAGTGARPLSRAYASRCLLVLNANTAIWRKWLLLFVLAITRLSLAAVLSSSCSLRVNNTFARSRHPYEQETDFHPAVLSHNIQPTRAFDPS